MKEWPIMRKGLLAVEMALLVEEEFEKVEALKRFPTTHFFA